MDDNLIKYDYKDAMENIVSDSAEKERVKALYDNETSNVTSITGRSRKISKFSAAVIAFACVLALSGGAVWAMTNSSLKEFFFKNSDKQYEEISVEIGKKYEFNNVDVILEESIYDESVGIGYTSFSVWDKEGNPVSVEGKSFRALYSEAFFDGIIKDTILDLKDSFISGFKVEGDTFYIVLLNCQSYYTKTDGNRLLCQFNIRQNDDEDTEKAVPEYILLNEEQYFSLYNDLLKLWDGKEIRYTKVTQMGKSVPFYSYNVDQPEVIDVLNRYDPVKVNIIDVPAQEILLDNMKIIVGRTNIVLEYIAKECDINSFALYREDGSKMEFTRTGYPRASEHWEVQGVDGRIDMPNGSSDGKHWKIWLNYGFLLGMDEKVTIEINGQDYR